MALLDPPVPFWYENKIQFNPSFESIISNYDLCPINFFTISVIIQLYILENTFIICIFLGLKALAEISKCFHMASF